MLTKSAVAYMTNRGWVALLLTDLANIEKLKSLQEKLRTEELYPFSDELREIIQDFESHAKYVKPDLFNADGTRRTNFPEK